MQFVPHLEKLAVYMPVLAPMISSFAQFVGCWTDDEKAAAIVRGTGSEGRSLDYLANVVAHLHDMGIDDTHLTALLKMSRARGCS